MDLIFLAVQPDLTTGKDNTIFADRIWVSSTGTTCAIIDGVSGCGDPVAASETCIEYLDAQDPSRLISSTGLVLEELNRFLLNRGLQAVIAIVEVSGNHVQYFWVGNPRMFSFFPTGNILSRIEPIESQPLAVLGQTHSFKYNSMSFELADEEIVLLTTDGINHEFLKNKCPSVLNARSYRSWQDLGALCQQDEDWSFVAFPIEKRFSYEQEHWPYNPFVGPQEDYEHEKRGLSKIVSELFRHPEFNGFKIVGGITFPNTNATRRLDGVLVSPLGVVLLELKDHDGMISLPLTNRQPMQIQKEGLFKESNPVSKVIEVMPSFERFNLGEDIDLPLRKIGAVIFTNPLAEVCCIASDGNTSNLPVKSGEIFVVTPQQLPGQLKAFVRTIKGKHNRRPLEEKVDRIVSALLNPVSHVSVAAEDSIVSNGYRIHKQQILHESTAYYKVFPGRKLDIDVPVWLKEYKLSQVSRGSPEEEEERIAREVMALEKLKFSDVSGIQISLGYFRNGNSLFVVLKEAPELHLNNWLDSNPSRAQRLNVLIRLAELMGELAENGIIHRAVCPANIRINTKIQPVLVNFELCRMETIQTLPVTGRQQLDSIYISREANSPGNKITPAADIYSLGKIIVFVLSGKLPFSTYHEQPILERKKGFWSEVSATCGLDDLAAKDLAAMLSINPARRPSALDVLEILRKWN